LGDEAQFRLNPVCMKRGCI